MKEFPSQLVNEIIEEINPTIKNFIEKNSRLLPDTYNSLEELVREILSANFRDQSFDQIKATYDAEKDKRKHKRAYWESKVKKNLATFPLTSDKSLFYHIPLEIMQRNEYYLSTYQTEDATQIVNMIMEEIDIWKKKKGYFIDCPHFSYFATTNILNSLQSDLYVNIYHIVKEKYDGNLNNWSIRHPLTAINNPVFSAQRGSVEMTQINQTVAAMLFSNDDYEVSFPEIPSDVYAMYEGKGTIPTIDERDFSIMSFLINNTVFDFNNTTPVIPEQMTNILAISKYVLKSDHPSTAQKNDIIARLTKLKTTIKTTNKKTGATQLWSLLDTVTIDDADDTGFKTVQYTLGKMVSDSVYFNQFISVPSSRYNILPSSYSRILYTTLQAERIARTVQKKSLTVQYSYSYIARILLLRFKKMSKNKELIIQALTELKNNGCLIESFSYIKNTITITYIPLSDEEKQDFLTGNGTLRLLQEYEAIEGN